MLTTQSWQWLITDILDGSYTYQAFVNDKQSVSHARSIVT